MKARIVAYMQKHRRGFIMLAALAGAMAIVTVVGTSKSHAGTSWTGCGAGVHGGLMEGAVNQGPIDIGSSGQTAGVSVFCDYQMAALVAGLFVDADRVWGDLHTLGANYDLSVGGRLGILPSQNALIYGHSEWTRFYTTGFLNQDVDAWGVGGGIEVKIKGTPASVDLRYTHQFVDNKNIAPGADIRGDQIRLGVNFKIGPNLQPQIFDDSPEPVPACDPKLANCKKR